MSVNRRISGDEAQYNAEISRRIEELRTRRGVQSSELAIAAGMSRQGFYDCEVGKVRWRPLHLRLIADYFRVTVEQLMPKSKNNTYNPAAPQELF